MIIIKAMSCSTFHPSYQAISCHSLVIADIRHIVFRTNRSEALSLNYSTREFLFSLCVLFLFVFVFVF